LPRPIHEGRDRYAIRIDEIDIDEDFIESEWRLPLDPSGLMEHSMYAVKEIC
jgi:hypothetical protein